MQAAAPVTTHSLPSSSVFRQYPFRRTIGTQQARCIRYASRHKYDRARSILTAAPGPTKKLHWHRSTRPPSNNAAKMHGGRTISDRPGTRTRWTAGIEKPGWFNRTARRGKGFPRERSASARQATEAPDRPPTCSRACRGKVEPKPALNFPGRRSALTCAQTRRCSGPFDHPLQSRHTFSPPP